MKWRLTMRSGVHARNDNVIGEFNDQRTAYLIADLLIALDKNHHPEYRGYTIEEVK